MYETILSLFLPSPTWCSWADECTSIYDDRFRVVLLFLVCIRIVYMFYVPTAAPRVIVFFGHLSVYDPGSAMTFRTCVPEHTYRVVLCIVN